MGGGEGDGTQMPLAFRIRANQTKCHSLIFKHFNVFIVYWILDTVGTMKQYLKCQISPVLEKKHKKEFEGLKIDGKCLLQRILVHYQNI